VRGTLDSAGGCQAVPCPSMAISLAHRTLTPRPCHPNDPPPPALPTEEDEPLARQPSSAHLIAAGKLLLVLTDTQINFTGEQTADAGSLIVTAHEARMTSYLGYVLCRGWRPCTCVRRRCMT
jgi:hypothetical protein